VASRPLSDHGTGPAVECRDLVVRYGSVTAVDGLSFTAEAGQVLAVLGPNGAGKTSTVETLEGYRRPAEGIVRVLGWDPVADHRSVVSRIGVMLQRGGVYPTMAPRQVLRLFSHYFDDPEDPDALLDVVRLRPVASTPWKRLSGGEQQRLSLALALVGKPAVLFLDEPTAGVDPEGRLAIRQIVAEQRDRGCCVVLTTHELAEAERLADDVLIVAHGRQAARGSPRSLARRATDPAISFHAPARLDLASLAAAAGTSVDEVSEPEPGHFRIRGAPTPTRVAALTGWLAEQNVPMSDLQTSGASLEEAYLQVIAEADR
jgi:ABC-2 type transport system ATP-binding protein